jgi:hypothetical protein
MFRDKSLEIKKLKLLNSVAVHTNDITVFGSTESGMV